jgi:glutamate racemase
MDARPIGMFDSGVGGLTVARAVIDLLPHENVIYVGDTARGPFGPLPLGVVQRYAFEIVEDLVSRDVKLIVVACNTATAAALTAAQARFRVPLVGVIEPGVRAAIRASRRGRVGVIGTEGTVRSRAYEAAMEATRSGVELFSLACPGFVELVEAGETGGSRVRSIVGRHLAPLRQCGVDVLILGCTHYPLLARVISETMGPGVLLISSADETAFEVQHLLESTGQLRRSGEPAWQRFVSSGDPATFEQLGTRFLGPEVGSVEVLAWT